MTADAEVRTDPAGGAASVGRLIQRAAVWAGVSTFVLRLAQFFVGVVVARLIAPQQFGVFAVALIVHTIVSNISDLGVSAAIVRTDRDLERVAPTVFTLALASSGLLTAAMFFSAPALAGALGAPAAAPAIRILSFTILLGGLTAVPYGILVKTYQQQKRFVADLANFTVSTGLVVVLALEGYGAEGLAWSRLIGLIVSWVLLTALITPRYLPGWRPAEARVVLAYCLPLAGASLVTFALINVDSVIVGRLLGPLALGFYSLAYNIAGWPVSVFGMMINEVALPAFAQARHAYEALSTRLAAVFALAASFALPVSLVCWGLSHALVVSVYGDKWSAAAPVLGVLATVGTLRIMITVLTIYLTAMGASRSVLLIQVVWICALVPALVVGTRTHGIEGAGFVQPFVAGLIVLPLAMVFVRRHGGGTFAHLVRACARPIGAVLLVALWLVLVRWVTVPGWGQLLLGGLGSVLLYLGTCGLWMRRLLARTRQLWDDDATVELVA